MNPEVKTGKKAIWILVIILALFALGVFGYLKFRKPAPLSQEEIIKKQAEELDALNKQMGIEPLTEEEIKKQASELDALNRQMGIEPLTEEEIKKQLEELNKLKGQ